MPDPKKPLWQWGQATAALSIGLEEHGYDERSNSDSNWRGLMIHEGLRPHRGLGAVDQLGDLLQRPALRVRGDGVGVRPGP